MARPHPTPCRLRERSVSDIVYAQYRNCIANSIGCGLVWIGVDWSSGERMWNENEEEGTNNQNELSYEIEMAVRI
jgi:hypothetical protein